MTKDVALHAFFSSFGLPAYVSTAVPHDVVFPFLTYSYVVGEFGDGGVDLTVNVWYYTESERIPNAKADEIAEAIGRGGKRIPCDGGFLWVKRGYPWVQSLTDDEDSTVKRRYMNVTVEYIITN